VTAVTPGQQAGYSGTPLPKKLGVKPEARVLLCGEPDGFRGLLAPLPDGAVVESAGPAAGDAALPGGGPFDVIVFFTVESAGLAGRLSELRSRMTPAAGLWIAFPKRASKVPTDMTDHAVRDIALPTGLVDNKICAIDAVWTGVRLVIRRELR
jgi:hypothetical protein